jgi:iron(III) transport system substrate-binding protein
MRLASRSMLFLAAAAMAAACLVGCGSSKSGSSGSSDDSSSANGGSSAWNAVLAAAKQEGAVTWYDAHVQAQVDSFQAAFTKAYPDIKLTAVRLVQTDSIPKVEAERTSGANGADVIGTADETFGVAQVAAGADRLKKLVGPDVSKLPPTVLRGNGLWAFPSFNVTELGWNTDLVKTPPKSYEDLLDPQYKGKIGFAENNNAATVSYWNTLASIAGPDYLTKLAAQKPKFYPTAAALSQGIASGEVSVTAYALPSVFGPLKATGAPVQYAPPATQKVWATATSAYALGWAKHPNAAQVLINFMFTPAGQEALAAGGVSVITPPAKSAVIKLAETIPADTANTTPAMTDASIAAWKKTFGR